MSKRKLRSVFISDVHLGTKYCQAEKLLNFLKTVECEYLFLVGDIVDVWSMETGKLKWPQAQSEVVRRILKMSKDTSVIYIAGNHDAKIRPYLPLQIGNIGIFNEFIHIGADGTRYLVTHGDLFDSVLTKHKWVGRLGAKAYNVLMFISHRLNKLRRMMGFRYWSLSKYLKHKAKVVTNVLHNFRTMLVKHAQENQCDAVIAGHIHTPEISGAYLNCGDWVESCSALVEDEEGYFELVLFDD